MFNFWPVKKKQKEQVVRPVQPIRQERYKASALESLSTTKESVQSYPVVDSSTILMTSFSDLQHTSSWPKASEESGSTVRDVPEISSYTSYCSEESSKSSSSSSSSYDSGSSYGSSDSDSSSSCGSD